MGRSLCGIVFVAVDSMAQRASVYLNTSVSPWSDGTAPSPNFVHRKISDVDPETLATFLYDHNDVNQLTGDVNQLTDHVLVTRTTNTHITTIGSTTSAWRSGAPRRSVIFSWLTGSFIAMLSLPPRVTDLSDSGAHSCAVYYINHGCANVNHVGTTSVSHVGSTINHAVTESIRSDVRF
jgi:hypothetical protein